MDSWETRNGGFPRSGLPLVSTVGGCAFLRSGFLWSGVAVLDLQGGAQDTGRRGRRPLAVLDLQGGAQDIGRRGRRPLAVLDLQGGAETNAAAGFPAAATTLPQ